MQKEREARDFFAHLYYCTTRKICEEHGRGGRDPATVSRDNIIGVLSVASQIGDFFLFLGRRLTAQFFFPSRESVMVGSTHVSSLNGMEIRFIGFYK